MLVPGNDMKTKRSNNLIRRIKDLVPLKWRYKARDGLNYLKYKRHTINLFSAVKGRKKIVLFMCPEHGNLGDQAIVDTENTFFRNYFPAIPALEISYNHYLYDRSGIIKHIQREDILATHGGGYFGMIYFHDEVMVRDILKSFPDNRIIVMPQTIFFDESERSREEMATSKSIMRQHSHLIFCAREKASYDFVIAKDMLSSNSNCHLIPDMFLYRNDQSRNSTRGGILLCFRRDHESVLDTSQKEEMEAIAQQTGEDVKWTDTVVDHPVSMTERGAALGSKFNEFRSAKLVITDRLHGMLFAAVTGTPCIALDNISGKIQGCYQWIKHLEYIRMAEKPSEIMDLITPLLSMDKCVFDNSSLGDYYDKLADLIRGNK